MNSAPKNLILISIDNLRYDALSFHHDRKYLRPYGLEEMPFTPNLDQLAREGAVFESCRSTASSTPPAHGSILTGRFPPDHGVRLFFYNQLQSHCPTLFEYFRDSGFECLAAVDFIDLFRAQRLTMGAELVHGAEEDTVLEKFREANRNGRRVLLFCHMADVHFPYGFNGNIRDTERKKTLKKYFAVADHLGVRRSKKYFTMARRLMEFGETHDQAGELGLPLYLNGVNQFDRSRWKRFFSKLTRSGILKDSLVMVTSDHGEAVIRCADGRRKFFHCEQVTEELIRVPWIVWSPNTTFLKKKRIKTPVSVADIVPTSLELMGLHHAHRRFLKAAGGVSRAPLIGAGTRGDEKRAAQPSISYAEAWYEDRAKLNESSKGVLTFLSSGEITEPAPVIPYRHFLSRRAIVIGNLKLVEDEKGNRFLYDIEKDPFETTNLLKMAATARAFNPLCDFTETASRMAAHFPIERVLPTPGQNGVKKKSPAKDLRLLERLLELGY